MPKGRPFRQPSGRNLELYHELIGEDRVQASVAARFRLSQPRVAQLRRYVQRWVDDQLSPFPRADQESCPVRRFHLAIALRRLYLTATNAEYLDHFGGPSAAAAHAHLLAAVGAGILRHDLAATIRRRRLIQAAVRMARELEDLARIARRGPFFDLPNIPFSDPAPR